MSSSNSEKSVEVELVLEVQSVESSEDPPIEEWSSLLFQVPEENVKRIAYDAGEYQPGSGEICTKYFPMSDSSVFRHPYYNYPSVTDPGISDALMQPEYKITFGDDGQDRYLAICKEMNQCPVGIFHRSLLNGVIDLKYYCVNPDGVRAMAEALQFNRIVKVLDMTDNFLNDDACYHLGQMLSQNATIKELNLSGCRIGPEGARRLCPGVAVNRVLEVLNLNKNKLGDAGLEHFAAAVSTGIDLKEIYLSYNNLGLKSSLALAEAIEFHNTLTHIDLSWNNLYSPLGICTLLSRLEENKVLQMLDLSWNALTGVRVAAAIKNLMTVPSLRELYLNNNRFGSDAVPNLIGNLNKAKKLVTLNLSDNPMTPQDSLKILRKMKLNAVKIQNLYLDNIFISVAFMELLALIKRMKSKKNVVVTYGNLVEVHKPQGPDAREIVLNRAEFLGKKPKRKKTDVALVILQAWKDSGFVEIMNLKEFTSRIRSAGAPLDEDLIEEILNAFSGPRSKKIKTINMKLLVDYVTRKWPERKLPPTPPPEPEPIVIDTKKGKEKDKKQKKKK